MEILCPACKKKSNINEKICQRCSTDLNVLITIRSASHDYLEQSRKFILAEDGEMALNAAQNAWNLVHTPQAAKQAFLASLFLKRFDLATYWYSLIQHQST